MCPLNDSTRRCPAAPLFLDDKAAAVEVLAHRVQNALSAQRRLIESELARGKLDLLGPALAAGHAAIQRTRKRKDYAVTWSVIST